MCNAEAFRDKTPPKKRRPPSQTAVTIETMKTIDHTDEFVKNNLEASRFHNLLLLREHARTSDERAAAGESICRALRRYLTEVHGLSESEAGR
jgi:hypothetical protein